MSSCVRPDGRVELALVDGTVGPPGPDEVVVRIDATPINPSDIGLLLAGADPGTARTVGSAAVATTVLQLERASLGGLGPRIDKSLPIGNEGAGTVVAAGTNAADLLGRVVACSGGGMWAQYRTVPAAACVALHPGTDARDAASAFVNPLTALGLLETARRDGHRAVVNTAAASNLGRMLVRICRADGVGLVNVVRSAEQVDLLRSLGAEHVCDSSADGFAAQLHDAIAATGATVAFDAIGGGPMTGRLLTVMEAVAREGMTGYSPYGSGVRTQVHVYGRLDAGPLQVDLRVGLAWQVGGWLLTPFLGTLDADDLARLRRRVADELTTTFHSSYGAEIPLADVITPDAVSRYTRRGTGQKYLILPNGNDLAR